MAQKFRGVPRTDTYPLAADLPDRDIRRMLTLSKDVFDGEYWRLEEPQYAAIIHQIDKSCHAAFHRQTGPDSAEAEGNLPNCGYGIAASEESGADERVASSARHNLIVAVRSGSSS